MTGATAPIGAFERREPRFDLAVLGLALVGATIMSGWFIAEQRALRVGIAVAVLVFFVGIGTLTRRQQLYLLVIWLAALGLVRRLTTTEISPQGDADPLLLVAPAVLGLLLLVAIHEGALRRRTALANAVLILSVLVFLGAFNPSQGSFVGGFAGLLFVLVPLLAFWVGRSLVDDAILGAVLKLFGGLAIAAAVYGLFQTFDGYPYWDDQWVRDSGYTALQVYTSALTGGVYRPFASFSSSAEYGLFLAIGVVIWLAFGLRLTRVGFALAATGFLGAALLYQSSRGIVVALVAAVALMVSARRRVPLALSIVISALMLVTLPIIVRNLPWGTSNGTPAGQLVTHQVEGLANPFDPATSTLLGHLSLLKEGLVSAFHDPLGLGVGAVTIASAKFGGLAAGTEVDPSNVGVALGLPGLLVYLVVLYLAFRRTYELAARRRDPLSLAALGILTVTLFQWLNGGHYAIAYLPWLLLGWVDRTTRDGGLQTTEEQLGPHTGQAVPSVGVEPAP